MLTAYQCEIVAAYSEGGGLYHLECAEGPVTLLIRYSLDEAQSARAEEYFDGEEGHVDGCGCEPALECDGCNGELAEAYVDDSCNPGGEAE